MGRLERGLEFLVKSPVLPCLIFEDEHLLVVNKPASLNTHAPSPYAGEGIYDWLRHREARWAHLAIIHRLDKETSGVLVFAKTPLANRSLTSQFTARTIRKKYLLLTDRPVRSGPLTVKSALVRAGERYVSRPLHPSGEIAETQFSPGKRGSRCQLVEAEPLTGKTHQIRVHAAQSGFPILGDTLYGGTLAPRVYLHAAELTLKHPASGEELIFCAPTEPDWAQILATGAEPGNEAFQRVPVLQEPATPLPLQTLREALIEPDLTTACRVIHGASDGWPGWYIDRLGDYLLSQSTAAITPAQLRILERFAQFFSARGAYHKLLTHHARLTARAEASPKLVSGQLAPERFAIRENGLQFELSFMEGYSSGLFLDQRDNRRRLLARHIASDFPLFPPNTEHREWELLNVFSYTCGFSVSAAKAGARTTSLDLSRRWLDWGKRNFALNQLDPAAHEFFHGDAFDWLRRLAKKVRRFDAIILDPPTFSQSKESGVFQAEKDYGRLVTAALPLLRASGVLFASTNAADWGPDKFLAAVDKAIGAAGRSILQQHYVPQPPDFPISRAESAYLKTAWLRVE